MSFVDLKEIFEQLTSWKIIPHLRNASSKIQLFFPEKYAHIKRSELPTYHPQSNRSTHWLADNSLFDGEQIGFCSLCKNVQTSDRPHYLSGFCTNNKNSTELKWVFWNLLIRDGKAVLEEMEEKTSDILKNACVIPGTQIYDDLLKKLSEWLADVFPFENYSYLYHDAKNLSDTVNKYLESNLPSALSRVIASCAIAGLNNQKINTAVRNSKEVKTVSWTNGANSKRQEQALDIIWPANAIEENSWRVLIRKGDHDLGIGKAQDAFLSYAQAANLAEALPNRESIEEYQRLIIQWMRARLLSASTDTLKVSARKEWDNLCKKHNSPYQSSAIFLRGQLKEKGYEYEQSSEDAFSDYLEAANHQDAPCEVLILVGQAFMYGSYGQSSDPQKAYTYFKKGYDKGNAQCAYHLAKLCEKHSELLRQIEGFDGDDLIQNCYERAAKGGIVSADKHLRNLRFCSEIEPNFEDGDLLTGCVCLLNSNHGSYANAFISNQNDFDGIYFGNICTLLANKAELLRYQKIVFAFFSDDHAVNVSEAVNLIRYMNDYSDRYGLRADWPPTYYFSFKNGSQFSGMLLVIGENIDVKKLGMTPMVFYYTTDGFYVGAPNGNDLIKFKVMDYTNEDIDLSLLNDNDMNTQSKFFGMLKTYVLNNMGMVYGIGIPSILLGAFFEIISNVFVIALVGYMFNKKLGLKFGKSMKLGIFCSLPMVLGTLFENVLGNGAIGVVLYYVGFFATIAFYVISSRWHLVEINTKNSLNDEFKENEENDNESI